MVSFKDYDWFRDLVLPLVILLVPLVLSVTGPGELLLLAFPVGIVVGYVLRPKHVWMVWLGGVVVMWAVYGTATITGLLPSPDEAGNGETIWSFMFESFIFMAALWLLPVWISRLFHKAIHEKIPEA